MKYISSCSFGKDSLATIILAKERGDPLDEVVYCEVMFDDHISGEIPEHRKFIHYVECAAYKGIARFLQSKNTKNLWDPILFNT